MKNFLKLLWKYIWNILVAIDQLFNTILLGDPDETISSRFGKWTINAKRGSFKWYLAMGVCTALHFIDRKHCEKAIEIDEGGDAIWRKWNKEELERLNYLDDKE